MPPIVEIAPVVRHHQTPSIELPAVETEVTSSFVPRSKRPTTRVTATRDTLVQALDGKNLAASYWRTLPLLIMGIFCYSLIWMLTGKVSPEGLANLFWADSYLVIQLLLAAGNFLFFTYLFQSVRVGQWFSLSVSMWLFFKFAHFLMTPPLTGSLLILTAIWWYLIVYRHRQVKTSPLVTPQSEITGNLSTQSP